MNTNRCKRCNYKTDLVLTETFYELSASNTFVKATIPDDAIDFEIVYRAEHGSKFTASRESGVYKCCEKINEHTLAVYIPLSRCSLGQGPLLRELIMSVPNNKFEGQEQKICIPADTKHLLWGGATDNDITVESDVVIATILKGNKGDDFVYEDFTAEQLAGLKAPPIESKFTNIYMLNDGDEGAEVRDILELIRLNSNVIIYMRASDGGLTMSSRISPDVDPEGSFRVYTSSNITTKEYVLLPVGDKSARVYFNKNIPMIISGGNSKNKSQS